MGNEKQDKGGYTQEQLDLAKKIMDALEDNELLSTDGKPTPPMRELAKSIASSESGKTH